MTTARFGHVRLESFPSDYAPYLVALGAVYFWVEHLKLRNRARARERLREARYFGRLMWVDFCLMVGCLSLVSDEGGHAGLWLWVALLIYYSSKELKPKSLD